MSVDRARSAMGRAGLLKGLLRLPRAILARLRPRLVRTSAQPSYYRVDRLASWLLVGPALKSEHYTRLAHEGVTHVLDLREERTDDQSVLRELGIAYRRLPLVNEDAPTDEQISEAVDWLEREVISADGAVYVHCQGGMGRAPTCSMALLMHRGYSLSDAHRLVLAARPETAPSDTQVAWLEALQARLRGDGPTMRQERASR